ncbi:alpha/beta hydrolase [Roseibacillus ishigakijimensis]|uniref:Alpha/beta fold hydrolase n=1 Tax=Roseibacillus ishigakijimensis TaxID=454146 RepID=A0A934RNL2_9BACT|nr:alpha/beta fold hydrolase [Roseibacillus ishigakijimensis]MBK1832618.1 alpha/beta fold hydrolase [Roseibacillus ishigakijimensis]
MKRRILAFFFLVGLLTLGVMIQVAGLRLTSPARAQLEDRHQEMLRDPARHGLSLTARVARDGTPYLLCRGLPGSGEKGRILQEQLQTRGIRYPADSGTLLLLHGHGGRKENHLAIAERFCAAGFTCLIPDLPAHGDHPGPVATFGVREVPLLQQLLREENLPQPVSVFGLSQGGAIALQLAAAETEHIQAVAAVSTFAYLPETLQRAARRQSPLLGGLLPLVSWQMKRRHRFTLSAISPQSSATTITQPCFLAHGADDHFIPPQDSERIFANLASKEKTLRLIPGAGHSDVLAKGQEIYADLTAFFLAAGAGAR